MDNRSIRTTPAGVERFILNTASEDGVAVMISLPQDPGQAGKSQVAQFAKMLSGYNVRSSTETGDKVTRFGPFSAQCEAGNVDVLRADWNDRWFSALEGFPAAKHDDDADSTSRAFETVSLRKGSAFDVL